MTDTAKLAGLRVLVVEDEMMVSMLIEDMLWTDLVGLQGGRPGGPPRRGHRTGQDQRDRLRGAGRQISGGQPIFPLADLLREHAAAPFAFATGYRRGCGAA